MKTVLATRNKGKLREFDKLLRGIGLELSALDKFPQVGELKEEGETFLDNARSKARETAQITGLPALADDSGLAVDFLDGRPGGALGPVRGPGGHSGGPEPKTAGRVERS